MSEFLNSTVPLILIFLFFGFIIFLAIMSKSYMWESDHSNKNDNKDTTYKNKFCTNCGSDLKQNIKFCSDCGAQIIK